LARRGTKATRENHEVNWGKQKREGGEAHIAGVKWANRLRIDSTGGKKKSDKSRNKKKRSDVN